MKKHDPVTKRFIHYMLMNRGEAQILVRDGKMGTIVTATNERDRWVTRVKSGRGRASKHEWVIEEQINSVFFQTARMLCSWDFSFDDYYEIYLWDFVPGASGLDIVGLVMNVSIT